MHVDYHVSKAIHANIPGSRAINLQSHSHCKLCIATRRILYISNNAIIHVNI